MRQVLRLLPRWSMIGFVVLMLVSVAVVWAAPGDFAVSLQAEAGTGYDPLSEREQTNALDAVLATGAVQAASVRESTPELSSDPVISAPAQEVLLVQRRQEAKAMTARGDWPRRADVYVYRYSDDTLMHSVYNYETGQIDQVEEVQGVQLPLTQAERTLAVEIAFADPGLRGLLNDEYARITGQPLTGPELLDIRVFVYHTGAAPDLETPETVACGVARCAQLMILTPDNATLEYLPIVNLSTLKVASTAPLALSAEDHHHHEGE